METTNKYRLLSYFYIVISVTLIGIGFIYEAFDFLYIFITASVLVIGILPLVHEKGIEWSTYISRILVGSLFVVSGLIKANDPLGFSYKLEEYFAESALNWPFFEPYSLGIAILVASSEIILGFAVLFGGKSKLTNWSLLGMILFFSWLTFYTAQCDPNGTYSVIENGIEVEHGVTCVTDCGCFGDALKGSIGRSLTPWESFKKDILLLVFVIILIVRGNFIKLNSKTDDLVIFPLSILFVIILGGMLFGWWFPLVFTIATFVIYLGLKQVNLTALDMDWQVALMVTIISFGFSWYCLTNLPQMDFRPYGVNKSIPLQMRTAEEIEGVEAPVFVYDYVLENKATKELKEVRSDAYMNQKMYEDTLWAFKETKGESYMIKDGYTPPIMSFNIGDEAQTEQILSSEEPIFILVSYDIKHADKEVQEDVNEFVKWSEEKGIRFIGASASLYQDVQAFKKENNNTFEYLEGDEKILKTVIRSNPGLVLLQNGVILGKWHYNNFPTFEEVQKELIK
ncbi:MAG: DoxX family protein [Flavobacteriales bacterium]|nr:DoxX family protein [Flavobacteriales bacterium]